MKKNIMKTGSAKSDQSYNSIIKRRTTLIQRLYKTVSRRNAKINDLNAFLDELVKEGRVTREELIERFKRVKNPFLTEAGEAKLTEIKESESELDNDENPFMPKTKAE